MALMSVGVDQEEVDLVLCSFRDLILEPAQGTCDGQFLADQRLRRIDRVATSATSGLEVVAPKIEFGDCHGFRLVLHEMNGQNDVLLFHICLTVWERPKPTPISAANGRVASRSRRLRQIPRRRDS